jgi:polyisoprenoid-binding protein YceI
MNRLALSFAVLGLMAAAVPPAYGESYVIDKSHAFVGFEIDHLGFSTTIGRFADYDARIEADWAALARSQLDVTIRTASIDTGWAERDAHLRSPDFFNAEAFPTMRFVSRAIEETGEGKARIVGDLTLLGVTRPLVLDAVLVKRGPHPMDPNKEVAGVKASGRLQRSAWGMDKYVPAVGDEVVLRIEAELNRAPKE